MEAYNLQNLAKQLSQFDGKVKGQSIVNIAAAEGVSPSTVREYLKGNVTIGALGKSILDRCRKMKIQKQATA